MKKILLALLLIVPTLASAHPSHISIGGNYTYTTLKPQGTPTLSGSLGGAQVHYEFRKTCALYEALNFIYRQGKLTGSPLRRTLHDTDGRGEIGYTLSACNLLLTPFTGIGWRATRHRLTQPKEPSVRFNYDAAYIPLGIYATHCLTPSLSIGLKGAWLPQIYTTLKIKPLNHVRWDLEKMLGNALIELPLTFTLSHDCVTWSLQLTPFFHTWQDGKTRAKTSRGTPLGIPKNTYTSGGASLSLIGSF